MVETLWSGFRNLFKQKACTFYLIKITESICTHSLEIWFTLYIIWNSLKLDIAGIQKIIMRWERHRKLN